MQVRFSGSIRWRMVVEPDQMPFAHTRRQFLATLPAMAALAQSKPLKIAAVEVWEVRGHRETMRGIDQQYQVNPLDIHDELRPKPRGRAVIAVN